MKSLKLLAIGSLVGGASLAFGVASDVTQLDIVVRDFQPNHPDFENFSEEAESHLNDIYNYKAASGLAMNAYGYDLTWYSSELAYHHTCGNMASSMGAQIAIDGKPKTINTVLPTYLQTVSTSATLEYGECQNSTVNGITQRGYKTVAKDASGNAMVQGFVCSGGNTAWANPVYYTPGMVKSWLRFDTPAEGEDYDMYDGVHIDKLNELCDNQYFDQWYSDVSGVNLRTNTTMDIPRDAASGYYIYDYNYNNGGYSPLDSINPSTGEYVGQKACNASIQPNGICEQFGPQSLSIFCPPYGYEYASSQTDYRKKNTANLCKSWLNYGGPRAINYGDGFSAAVHAAIENGTLGQQHLRNYAFTMMGYAKFKYKAANQTPSHEVFEFAGDDDMWIFVDGVLAVDLGGTHLSAPGSVDIATLAANNHGCHSGEPLSTYTNCEGASDATGWADNTWHHLHFFYADRQTDGSNIYIRSSLAEVAPSRYGQPSIGSVTVKVDETGAQTTSILLNTTLSDSTINYINNLGSSQPTMVVMRTVTNADGTTSVVTYGYYINNIQGPVDKGASGQLYTMSGVLKDADGNEVAGGILGSDKLAFNSPYDADVAADTDLEKAYESTSAGLWTALLQWNTKLNFDITSGSGKSVVGYPDTPADWAVVNFFASIDVDVIPPDSTIDRPDFNEAATKLTEIADNNDGELPLNASADLILVSLPENVGKLGNPLNLTEEEAKQYGAAGEGGALGANTSVYSAGDDSGNSTTSTCFSSNGVESCPTWYFAMSGPFRINIRVFDNLGHFVNQYQQTVTEDMLKKALGDGKTQSSCPDVQMFGSTGVLLAAVKMYPVSQNGRLLGTGPYIYQVTVVQEEYKPCINKGQSQITENTVNYTRTSDTYIRGYRRSKK